jgi:hypothetical protein
MLNDAFFEIFRDLCAALHGATALRTKASREKHRCRAIIACERLLNELKKESI